MKLSPEIAQFVFWLAVACCAFAQAAILRSTWVGMQSGDPSGTEGSDGITNSFPRLQRAPELIWAVIPAVALVFVFAGTWKAMHRVSDAGGPPIHVHPPATVSGAPTQLAIEYASPARRVHKPARVAPTIERKIILEGYSVDVGDEPEEYQR